MPDLSPAVDPNEHIVQYLNYYIDPANFFDFGVMIKGPWGSGKTYFIKNFLEQRRAKYPDDRYLYVTLYGVSKLSQVDDALFRQLHPVLSSKGMKIAAAVGKGLLKTTLKIDLDAAGKDDVVINSQLPDLNVVEFLKIPKECLLVFDDLERCSVPIPDILGYINSFVEHEGFKVIVLADESKLPAKHEKYVEIKEKLIGQTLEIRPTVNHAIFSFLPLIRNEKVRQLVEGNLADVLYVYGKSQTNNLRILKQALWDFERLANCFAERHWQNEAAIKIILRVVIALSFEMRAARLSPQNIHLVKYSPGFRHFDSPEGKTFLESLEARYSTIAFYDVMFSSNCLSDFLFGGWADPNLIQKELDESSYYHVPSEVPTWRTAWELWHLEDSLFEEAVRLIEQQFQGREFSLPGEMFHVFGLRLMFSEVGIIQSSKEDIVTQCKAYIDDIKSQGKILDKYTEKPEIDVQSYSAYGRVFASADSAEFRDILRYYDTVVDEVAKQNLPRAGVSLLELMKADPMKFFRQICPNEVEPCIYFDAPILAAIPAKDFATSVLSLDPDSIRIVFRALRERRPYIVSRPSLSDEKEWFAAVKTEFESAAATLSPLSKYRLLKYLTSLIVDS